MQWKYFEPRFEYEDVFKDIGLHWSGHKKFAYDLVGNNKPVVIVELGTWKGTSFFSFCQALKDFRFNSKIYAVDTWEGDLHMGRFENDIYQNVEILAKKYYNSVDYTLLKMTFDEAVGGFKDNSIDILHIDGLHTYEGAKHDFENWRSKVSPNGIILFHDINVKKDGFGVYELWEELKEEYATIEFSHSFGLGILFVSMEYSRDIVNLQKEFKFHYSLAYEETKNFEINNLFSIVKKNEHIISQKKVEIFNLDQKCNQKDQEISSKNQEILHRDQKFEQKEEEVQNMDREIILMKSSKFWKLRDKYLKLKKKLYKFLKILNPLWKK
jgi:hypothetical protein